MEMKKGNYRIDSKNNNMKITYKYIGKTDTRRYVSLYITTTVSTEPRNTVCKSHVGDEDRIKQGFSPFTSLSGNEPARNRLEGNTMYNILYETRT